METLKHASICTQKMTVKMKTCCKIINTHILKPQIETSQNSVASVVGLVHCKLSVGHNQTQVGTKTLRLFLDHSARHRCNYA